MNDEDKRIAKAVAEILNEAKESGGFSYEDIAAMTGFSRSHVTRIFYGLIDVRLGDVRRIGEVLDLKLEDVLSTALRNAQGKPARE